MRFYGLLVEGGGKYVHVSVCKVCAKLGVPGACLLIKF